MTSSSVPGSPSPTDRRRRLLARVEAALAARRRKMLAEMVLTIITEPHPWQAQTICCGHDDGTVTFTSWDEADAFRTDYVTEAPDHDRVAIVSRSSDG